MTRRTRILVLLLATALLVTTLGWIRATDRFQIVEDAPARFEGCTFDGNRLVLRYAFGANQLVAPSMDTRHRDRIIVELGREVGEGPTVAIGLGGQAEFSVYGADENTVIEYPDGERLKCEQPTTR